MHIVAATRVAHMYHISFTTRANVSDALTTVTLTLTGQRSLLTDRQTRAFHIPLYIETSNNHQSSHLHEHIKIKTHTQK